MFKILDPFTSNPNDSCHALAMELAKELKETFAYVLDPKHPEFCPEFIVATFLTPELKWMIKTDQKPVIRKYLEGKFILCKVWYRFVIGFLIGMVPGGGTQPRSKNLTMNIAGLEMYQEEFTAAVNAVSSGRGKFILCKVNFKTLREINFRWVVNPGLCHVWKEGGCLSPCLC